MNGLRKSGLYTMEFYSAMKKNEILSFPNKWTGEHHPEKG
jgi:hypothetical protein